jgi:hypothetical protein
MKEELCDQIEEKEHCGILDIVGCYTLTQCGSGITTGSNNNFYGIGDDRSSKFPISPTDGFHDYVVEWKANKYIDWFIDGRKVLHQPLNKNFKMNFNQSFDQIGAPFDKYYFPRFYCYKFQKEENETTEYEPDWENALLVDYIQVYEWIDDEVDSVYKLIIVLVSSLLFISLIIIIIFVIRYRTIKKINELKKTEDHRQFNENTYNHDIVYDEIIMESADYNNVAYVEVNADQEYDVIEDPRYDNVM